MCKQWNQSCESYQSRLNCTPGVCASLPRWPLGFCSFTFHSVQKSTKLGSLVGFDNSLHLSPSQSKWNILKEMGIPDHLSCLLRNLYADQEATVIIGHGTTDCFQIGKGVCQGCILSPCLFNFYAEYIMRNAGLEEAQAGIKIAGRNISNLRWQKVKRSYRAS